MMRTIAVAVLVALTAACSSARSRTPPQPQTPAERLHAILATPITFEQDALYQAFAAEQGADILLLLPVLALDSSADPLARANAVLRMGAVPLLDFDVYRRTIEDPDPRVRGATLGVVGGFALTAAGEAMPILARGLIDPEIGIQAKALQELRDRDLDLLRFYIGRNPPAELRNIAIETIRHAQAWGAPLEPEADGTLRRTTPSGAELVFRPDTVFRDWELAIGTLTVVRSGAAPRLIADSVEVVANVIPAVVDATGGYVAIETSRRIEVHDLESGAVRQLGPGIAPRPLPFTTDFLFFREIDRMYMPDGARIVYEFMRAPFESGSPVAFDEAPVPLQASRRGYLSPLRWARIHDRGTAFVVDTEGLRNHVLPSPLAEVTE